jgi:hypothetical protein
MQVITSGSKPIQSGKTLLELTKQSTIYGEARGRLIMMR